MGLSLDEDGHLADPGDWSACVAKALANEAGVQLGTDHWRVIDTVRAFHAVTGVAPSMRPLVKLVRGDSHPELGSSIALMGLFPGSPATLAAKIAGLPRPDKCL